MWKIKSLALGLIIVVISVHLSFQDCDVLKKKFEEMCKMNGTDKEVQIQKAKDCYPQLLPPDGDQKVKDYFIKKCQNIDYCDSNERRKCGPEAFSELGDNEREAAMKFFEKHRDEFPDLCKKGMQCMGFKL